MTTPAPTPPVRTRLGLQIPNFTYPDVEPADLFERVAAIAGTAERSGFDTVFVMDHFFQLPLIGPPEHEMFEAYTLLSGIAARTERARLGTLVTGVTYRNPALLAKEVTSLDVISRGRALLGIGAAWFEEEHRALGFDFPPLRQRYEHFEDALRICRAMFTERQSTVVGTHHHTDGAWNVPRPTTPGGPPILIGGSGERRTIPLAARYADELNLHAGFSDLPRKLEALDAALAAVGRPRGEIGVTCLGFLVVGATHEQAAEKLAAMLRLRGVADPALLVADRAVLDAAVPRVIWGDPDEVGEQASAVLGLGLDGLVVNMVADGHDLESVALAGEALARVVGAPAR
jgi:F420-dependent oxidoreductase-like protein